MTQEPSERAAALLARLQNGAHEAGEALLPLVYEELRAVAGRMLGAQRALHTLQPTALVHEAYLRLVRGDERDFEGRAHFFGVAAKAMRQILIDHARARAANKRGGDWNRITITHVGDDDDSAIDVLDLEACLRELARSNPRPAQVAELRFFAGLEVEEVAGVLGVSARTVKSDWRFARAWLRRALEGGATR